MKKYIAFSVICIAALLFFVGFTHKPDPGVKSVIISVLTIKKEFALRIDYGDGQSETRNTGVSVSAFDPFSFTQVSPFMAKTLHEFRERGYRLAAINATYNWFVLEKE